MKLLANIFLSGLAILACVSCSKDEDPVLPLEGAKLSVAVKASGTATKAYNPNDVNELEGEAYINNLAVVVFNETGTELLGYKWEALSGAEHSAIIADVPTTKAVRAPPLERELDDRHCLQFMVIVGIWYGNRGILRQRLAARISRR